MHESGACRKTTHSTTSSPVASSIRQHHSLGFNLPGAGNQIESSGPGSTVFAFFLLRFRSSTGLSFVLFPGLLREVFLRFLHFIYHSDDVMPEF